MTEVEWLDIGYDKGIIDVVDNELVTFSEAYKKWFIMRMKCCKAQSMDRIEVTYNKYFYQTDFVEMHISKISDSDISNFLFGIVSRSGTMTYKEFGRILQIVRSPLLYMRDIGYKACSLHDWDAIKRNMPIDKLSSKELFEFAIPEKHINELMYNVIHNRIYACKQNASLCLCMNFFLGLRIGELASLAFDDFDFEKGVVKIYKTEVKSYNRDDSGEKLGTMVYSVSDTCKTVYSVREIPILPEVKFIYELIKENHEKNHYDSPFLCYDGTDTILVRSLDRTLRRLCLLCDIPYFHSHEIRKTFATTLHYSGMPTRLISDLMGHSEISTTENSYILNYKENYIPLKKYMEGALRYEFN